jgi:hypothetical protein
LKREGTRPLWNSGGTRTEAWQGVAEAASLYHRAILDLRPVSRPRGVAGGVSLLGQQTRRSLLNWLQVYYHLCCFSALDIQLP